MMWAFGRLGEFNRAYHAADIAWDRSEALASLQFAQGLMLSCLLVTPFWTAVGIFLHHLTR
ncbi:MAG TPA: hypothetical protein VMD98_10650 [Bryocella sp.]|nr:hypothetical protein [Bryocella sp.]